MKYKNDKKVKIKENLYISPSVCELYEIIQKAKILPGSKTHHLIAYS